MNRVVVKFGGASLVGHVHLAHDVINPLGMFPHLRHRTEKNYLKFFNRGHLWERELVSGPRKEKTLDGRFFYVFKLQ